MTMQEGTSKDELVQLVVKHERLLALLYQVFMDRFPEHQAIWESLIRDHQAHIVVLEELLSRAERNVVTLDSSAFHNSTIMYSVEYVSGQVVKALTDADINAGVALGLCYSLEHSGLAQKFYNMFRPLSYDEGMKAEFSALDAHVTERNEMLQNYTRSWKQVA